jgi:chromosome segregation ATPase
MDEGQRRSEILQAEEAIRLLAEELAKAKSTTAAADEVRLRLEQAVEILARAGNSVTEAMLAQSDLVEESKSSTRAAGEECRETLSNAAERLRACLKDVHDTYGQFQTAATGIAARTEQMAQLVESKLDRVSSSVTALDRGLSELRSLIQPMEAKLSDLSASVAVATATVAEARQDAKRSPGELAAQVRHSLARRSTTSIYTLVLAAMSFVGVCAILLWLIAHRAR